MSKEIHIFNLDEKLGKIQIRIEKPFIRKLISNASRSDKPHMSKNFMAKLRMMPNVSHNRNITIYGWGRYTNSIPLNKLTKIMKLSTYSWSYLEKNVISIKGGGKKGEVYIKFPIKIDQKLGSIIGHLIGDGSISLKYKQVSFSNSNKELLKEFEHNMFSVFGIKPRIWAQREPIYGKTKWDKRLDKIVHLKSGRNCGLFYPSICGVVLNSIFNSFCIGKRKKITNEIANANKYFKSAFIRSFFDSEGSVGYKRIRVFQDDKRILHATRKILSEFDITPGGIKKYKKREKDRHYFDIFRKSNFMKFQKEIGFTSPEKARKLSDLTIIRRPDIIK